MDDVCIRWQMFNFAFLPLKRWFQFNSRIIRAHFASILTSNNWEMIAETRGYIFRWRSRSMPSTSCLLELPSYSRWREESPALVVKLYRKFHHRRRRSRRHHRFLHGIPTSFQRSLFSSLSLPGKGRRATLGTRLQEPLAHNKNGTITFWTILYSSTNVYPESRINRDINHLTMQFWRQTWSSLWFRQEVKDQAKHMHTRETRCPPSLVRSLSQLANYKYIGLRWVSNFGERQNSRQNTRAHARFGGNATREERPKGEI